jgi:hypothetical protein
MHSELSTGKAGGADYLPIRRFLSGSLRNYPSLLPAPGTLHTPQRVFFLGNGRGALTVNTPEPLLSVCRRDWAPECEAPCCTKRGVSLVIRPTEIGRYCHGQVIGPSLPGACPSRGDGYLVLSVGGLHLHGIPGAPHLIASLMADFSHRTAGTVPTSSGLLPRMRITRWCAPNFSKT